jgi:ubiquinone/menaquinone biosynthesis C-methylase UbiE
MARHGLRQLATLAAQSRFFWQSPINRWVVDEVDPQPGEYVLDIGAGIGPATVLTARRVDGGWVQAVEPSLLMRSGLRTRSVFQRSRHRIVLSRGKAEALPVADGCVDAAYSINSAHHWHDFDAAAAELHRVLRPGGRILLLDEAFDDPDHPLAGLMERHDEEHGIVDESELAETLAGHGFADAEGGKHSIRNTPVRVVRAVKAGD